MSLGGTDASTRPNTDPSLDPRGSKIATVWPGHKDFIATTTFEILGLIRVFNAHTRRCACPNTAASGLTSADLAEMADFLRWESNRKPSWPCNGSHWPTFQVFAR